MFEKNFCHNPRCCHTEAIHDAKGCLMGECFCDAFEVTPRVKVQDPQPQFYVEFQRERVMQRAA